MKKRLHFFMKSHCKSLQTMTVGKLGGKVLCPFWQPGDGAKGDGEAFFVADLGCSASIKGAVLVNSKGDLGNRSANRYKK